MKIKLDDELEEKVIKITGVDYKGLLEWNDIESLIKDLILAYHDKEHELEDHIENCKENHISKPLYYED